jgi:hypothetical protein
MCVQVAQMLFRNYGGSLKQYPLTCRVPPGEGTGVPVILTRDNSTSGPFPISYQRPSLTNITVTDPGTAQGPVTSDPTFVQLVPTLDGVMTLAGANFGFNPVVTIGDLGCVVFSNSTPTPPAASAPCALSPYAPTASTLRFDFPRGVGTGIPLTLDVAGQGLPFTVIVNYKPPTITTVTLQGGATTQGGSLAVLSGRNFGQGGGANPIILLTRVNSTGGLAIFQCNPLAPQVCGMRVYVCEM